MKSINKWVYWCYNFTDPKEWINEIWRGIDADHFYNKFSALYELYGSRAVMNTFYLELSDTNQKKLLDWVLSNYNNERSLL